MKTYTLTTDDDSAIMRAAQADSLAWIVWEMDQELRKVVEDEPNTFKQAQAEYWRDYLRKHACACGVVIDGLFE